MGGLDRRYERSSEDKQETSASAALFSRVGVQLVADATMLP